jgi:cell pole-organizing protein PopZ
MAETRGDNEPSMEEILASIRRIISEDSQGRRAATSERGEGAVLDLTEMLTSDGSVVSLASRRTVLTPASPESEQTPAVPTNEKQIKDKLEESLSSIVPNPGKEREPAMTEADARANVLSDNAFEASSTSLSRLAKAVKREAALRALSLDDDRRIEDLVQEALQPLLKDWLDRNLPGLVDQVVRDEIEKMVRRLQDA